MKYIQEQERIYAAACSTGRHGSMTQKKKKKERKEKEEGEVKK